MKPPPIILPTGLLQRVREDFAAELRQRRAAWAIAAFCIWATPKAVFPAHVMFTDKPRERAVQRVSLAVQRGVFRNWGESAPHVPGPRLRQFRLFAS